MLVFVDFMKNNMGNEVTGMNVELYKETKYLAFVTAPQKGKTKIITIINKHHQDVIGEIKWHGNWRQYCFFPIGDTIWNRGCMKDIDDVITELMDERKNN